MIYYTDHHQCLSVSVTRMSFFYYVKKFRNLDLCQIVRAIHHDALYVGLLYEVV